MGKRGKSGSQLHHGSDSAATSFSGDLCSGKNMMQLYQENQKKMSQGGQAGSTLKGAGPEGTHSGSEFLADLHATSCGLKSLAISIVADGLEVCRRACGAHGCSSFSGIQPWYSDYLPTTTWEGDNYMLTQQVARYVSFLLHMSMNY